jgi:acyl dehydratase
MELDSGLAGTPLRDYRTTVGWRETMNFAAAVDDPNEAYFDDARADGVIASPMFSVALTWPILGRIWEFIDSPAFPLEVLATQVHYTEHLEFHRPVRPGDALTIGGRITAILPHRSGTLVVICLAARDGENRPVFTEHIGALLRGVTCGGPGRGGDRLPASPQPPEGPSGWETILPIPPLMPFVYDGCTAIVFPIHTSRQFARQVGLPGIILQGTATLALAVREIVNREAGGDPARLGQLACRFTGMVRPGTPIRILRTGRVPSPAGADIFFEVLNSDGQSAVKGGFARIVTR